MEVPIKKSLNKSKTMKWLRIGTRVVKIVECYSSFGMYSSSNKIYNGAGMLCCLSLRSSFIKHFRKSESAFQKGRSQSSPRHISIGESTNTCVAIQNSCLKELTWLKIDQVKQILLQQDQSSDPAFCTVTVNPNASTKQSGRPWSHEWKGEIAEFHHLYG